MRLELPLPGDWYSVPIGEADARTRIRRFAEEVHGASDARALERIRLRRRLHLALAHAERGRAQQLHLGRALDGGVPLPASLAVYPGIAVSTATAASSTAVMDALVPLVLRAAHEPHGGSAVAGPEDRVLASPRSLVLRRPSIEHVDDPDLGALPTLRVDYWITVPGERHAVLVHAIAPDTPFAPLMRDLFDEIVVGARFASDSSLAAELRA